MYNEDLADAPKNDTVEPIFCVCGAPMGLEDDVIHEAHICGFLHDYSCSRESLLHWPEF